MGNSIVVQYTLTGEMAANAQAQFDRRGKPPVDWRWLVAIWALGTLVSYGLISIRGVLKNDETLRWGWAALAASVMGLVAAFKKPEVLPEPNFQPLALPYELSEKGIEKTTALVQSKVEWAAFSGYFETDGYFFIIASATSLELLPKHVISVQEVESVRSLLISKLPKQKEYSHDKFGKIQRIGSLILSLLIGAFLLAYYARRSG